MTNRVFRACWTAKQLVIPALLWATVLAGNVSGGTISFSATDQGSGVFRYEFKPQGLILAKHQEIDIQFDPTLFGNLFNGVADSDFRLVLLQPDNPSGAAGDYSALALVDNPSMTGPFSVDVTWLGTGQPGDLPFVIHQFDATGQHIIGTITSVPEPASWLLTGAGLIIGFYFSRTVQRRR
jgi:hypothetical protein